MPEQLLAGKDVAIAGAGLGGLAFGLSLLKLCRERGVEPLPRVRIFDRDSSATARVGQGYSLSVRSDSGGLQVLHRLGMLESLLPFQEPGQAISFATAGFRHLASFISNTPSGLPMGRLRISRSQLRQQLLERFEERHEKVAFDSVCTGVKLPVAAGERVTLSFQDGTQHQCDVLIASDGANSKMRSSLLPDLPQQQQLHHSGLVMLQGRTTSLKALPPILAQGAWLAVAATGSCLFLSTLEKDTVSWSISWKAPQQLAAQLHAQLQDPATAQDVVALAEQRGKAFAEPWPTIWAATEKQRLQASAVMQKLPHSNTAPVVFIGDSCHAMLPFAGNGANMAFKDAWQLAEQLTDPRHRSLQEAVGAYDAEAAPRSTQALQEGVTFAGLCHKQGWGHAWTVLLMVLMGLLFRLAEVVVGLRRLTQQ